MFIETFCTYSPLPLLLFPFGSCSAAAKAAAHGIHMNGWKQPQCHVNEWYSFLFYFVFAHILNIQPCDSVISINCMRLLERKQRMKARSGNGKTGTINTEHNGYPISKWIREWRQNEIKLLLITKHSTVCCMPCKWLQEHYMA